MDFPKLRKYRSGSAWAVWRWTVVDWRGDPYLVRLHLLKTPWFAVMMHWFYGPDPHPDPHDHPTSFASLTLRGGYDEWRPRSRWRPACGVVRCNTQFDSINRRRFRTHRAPDVHKVVAADPGTLTLVLAGPVVRRWGFHTPGGWVDWKAYRDMHAR